MSSKHKNFARFRSTTPSDKSTINDSINNNNDNQSNSNNQSNNNNQPKNGKNENNENSALVERFNQILESKLSESKPMKSIIDNDEKLSKLYQDYQTDESIKNREFDNTYQRQLGQLKSEPLLKYNKHAKDIADTVTNKPWDGKESLVDANLRMLIESKPPPIKIQNQQKLFTPPLNPHDRLVNAKEGSLDYKINKDIKKNESVEDNWKELYKERLLGPSMLINSSNPNTTIGLINTMANQVINSSINNETGQFDSELMNSVRGKPLDAKHLANSTDSNYFINQILNKQEVLPPWIENQKGIDKEISVFRNDLDKKWFTFILNKLKTDNNDNKILILGKIKNLQQNNDTSNLSLFDVNFQNRQIPFINAKINLINRSIRDYNLQCPSSRIHKFKLVTEVELKNLFDRVMSNLPPLIDEWYKNEEQAKLRKNSNVINYGEGGGLFGLFDNSGGGGTSLGNIENVKQRPTENLKIWKSIKEMFKS